MAKHNETTCWHGKPDSLAYPLAGSMTCNACLTFLLLNHCSSWFAWCDKLCRSLRLVCTSIIRLDLSPELSWAGCTKTWTTIVHSQITSNKPAQYRSAGPDPTKEERKTWDDVGWEWIRFVQRPETSCSNRFLQLLVKSWASPLSSMSSSWSTGASHGITAVGPTFFSFGRFLWQICPQSCMDTTFRTNPCKEMRQCSEVILSFEIITSWNSSVSMMSRQFSLPQHTQHCSVQFKNLELNTIHAATTLPIIIS